MSSWPGTEIANPGRGKSPIGNGGAGFMNPLGWDAVDGTVECLHGSHESARSIPAGFCRGDGLYVRVAGMRFLMEVNNYQHRV